MATIREMMGHRRLKTGTFLVEFATPGIGHILKTTGLDFVLFDMEHSGITLDLLKSALRYLEAAGLPAIVGLPSKDPHQGRRAVSLAVSHDRFRMRPPAEMMAEANRRICYFAKIETRTGVENVEA